MTERSDTPSTVALPSDGASVQEPHPWSAPEGTGGNGTLVRTNLPAARGDKRDCPTAVSAKARPFLQADPKPPYIPESVAMFGLRAFTATIDRVEAGAAPEAVIADLRSTSARFEEDWKAPAHRGHVAWTQAAVRRFLAAREEDQRAALGEGRALTRPAPAEWVVHRDLASPDANGARAYERTAWGRRYASDDGRLRELWLISQGPAKASRPDAELAAAAYVCALGHPAADGGRKPYRPLTPGRDTGPSPSLTQRIRIVEFGCADGVARVLADWSRQECLERFARDAAPILDRAVESLETRPGSSCVQCKAIAGCSALPRATRLLELAAPRQRPRSSLSVSDLRYHRECPAKFHLARNLSLKSLSEENPAIRLGRAVDAVLNLRHDAKPAQACARSSEAGVQAVLDELGIDLDEAVCGAAARMLDHHATYCPLADLGERDRVLVQHQVTCYDEALNAVFIATPDLLYTRRDGWVWRETKTSSRGVYEGESLLRNYPQLALAALMINSGALGGNPRRSMIELEVLTVDDVIRLEVSPTHPRVLAEAREVLASGVEALMADTSYPETPGEHCEDCEVLEWCAPGGEHLAHAREAQL